MHRSRFGADVEPLEYSKQRVDAFLRQVTRLKESDFPHEGSRVALDRIESHFQGVKQTLELLTPENDARVVQQACSDTLRQIFAHHRLLGFILRSTNVRNSFEVYGPLLRIARRVLGPDSSLVLSSEWDYSPHVYRSFDALPGTVLLGLPACESDNPLLVPLAGHELGHTAWQRHSLMSRFQAAIQSKVTADALSREAEYKQHFVGHVNDLFAKQNLAPAYSYAARQAEETFCDFVGVRLFGEGYFHAFSYLLAPGLVASRTGSYPLRSVRVSNMEKAAKHYHAHHPNGFAASFLDEQLLSDDRTKFLVSLADAALAEVVPSLLQVAGSLIDTATIPLVDDGKIDTASRCLQRLTPVAKIGSLAEIIVAGWRAYHDRSLWIANPRVHADRFAILKELVLKSVEVLEIEQLTGVT